MHFQNEAGLETIFMGCTHIIKALEYQARKMIVFKGGARSNYQETRCARLVFLKLNTLVRSRFIRKLAVRVIHIISNSMRYSWVYRQDTSQNNTWDEMLHNKSLTVVIWIVFIDFCRYPTCGHRDWRYQDQCCASFKNSEHLKNIKL